MFEFYKAWLAKPLIQLLGGISVFTKQELQYELFERTCITKNYTELTIANLVLNIDQDQISEDSFFDKLFALAAQPNALKAQKAVREFVKANTKGYTDDDLKVIANILVTYK